MCQVQRTNSLFATEQSNGSHRKQLNWCVWNVGDLRAPLRFQVELKQEMGLFVVEVKFFKFIKIAIVSLGIQSENKNKFCVK